MSETFNLQSPEDFENANLDQNVISNNSGNLSYFESLIASVLMGLITKSSESKTALIFFVTVFIIPVGGFVSPTMPPSQPTPPPMRDQGVARQVSVKGCFEKVLGIPKPEKVIPPSRNEIIVKAITSNLPSSAIGLVCTLSLYNKVQNQYLKAKHETELKNFREMITYIKYYRKLIGQEENFLKKMRMLIILNQVSAPLFLSLSNILTYTDMTGKVLSLLVENYVGKSLHSKLQVTLYALTFISALIDLNFVPNFKELKQTVDEDRKERTKLLSPYAMVYYPQIYFKHKRREETELKKKNRVKKIKKFVTNILKLPFWLSALSKNETEDEANITKANVTGNETLLTNILSDYYPKKLVYINFVGNLILAIIFFLKYSSISFTYYEQSNFILDRELITLEEEVLLEAIFRTFSSNLEINKNFRLKSNKKLDECLHTRGGSLDSHSISLKQRFKEKLFILSLSDNISKFCGLIVLILLLKTCNLNEEFDSPTKGNLPSFQSRSINYYRGNDSIQPTTSQTIVYHVKDGCKIDLNVGQEDPKIDISELGILPNEFNELVSNFENEITESIIQDPNVSWTNPNLEDSIKQSAEASNQVERTPRTRRGQVNTLEKFRVENEKQFGSSRIIESKNPNLTIRVKIPND